MKTLSFAIDIAQPPARVWEVMLTPGHFTRWSGEFCPGSHYVGEWEEGKTIDFLTPEHGGTRAMLDLVQHPSRILARHVLLLTPQGGEDGESEDARAWIGTTESYTLTGAGAGTELKIEVTTPEKFIPMYQECWPKALAVLKGLCEKSD